MNSAAVPWGAGGSNDYLAAAPDTAGLTLPGVDTTANFLLSTETNLGSRPTAVRRRVWATRFTPEHLYEHFAAQSALTLSALPPGHPRIRELPSHYISILPLDAGWESEAGASAVSGSYGYASTVYKAISSEDGMAYALRRVENVRAPVSVLDAVVAAWSKAAHPSIVRLRSIFGSAAGGPGALFFVHDYHPAAKSLKELFIAPGSPGIQATTSAANAVDPNSIAGLNQSRSAPIPERTLWSYVCQLALGLRAAHDADLAFRGLQAAHVVVTSNNRVRITGAGILDVLESDTKKSLQELQQADILSLGHLILQLATRSPNPQASMDASLEAVKGGYSVAIYTLLIVLLSKPVTIQEVLRLIAPQLMTELDSAYDHSDACNELLSREIDNGRHFRTLVKLGFVNERPSHEGDPAWSETGDRYLLKLYRDFLFHQGNEEGKPVIDLAHVVDSLNALDVGSADRRIVLSSRDGATLLVATYAQLRRALNASFDELRSSAYQNGVAAAAALAAASAPSGGGPGATSASALANILEASKTAPAAVRKARAAAATAIAASSPATPYAHANASAAASMAAAAAAAAATMSAAAAAGAGVHGVMGGFGGLGGDLDSASSLFQAAAAAMAAVQQGAGGGGDGGGGGGDGGGALHAAIGAEEWVPGGGLNASGGSGGGGGGGLDDTLASTSELMSMGMANMSVVPVDGGLPPWDPGYEQQQAELEQASYLPSSGGGGGGGGGSVPQLRAAASEFKPSWAQ